MLSVIMWLLRLYHAYIREILMKFLTHAQSKYLESCGSWQGKTYHIRKVAFLGKIQINVINMVMHIFHILKVSCKTAILVTAIFSVSYHFI